MTESAVAGEESHKGFGYMDSMSHPSVWTQQCSIAARAGFCGSTGSIGAAGNGWLVQQRRTTLRSRTGVLLQTSPDAVAEISVHSLGWHYITSLTQIRARESHRERVAVRASWDGYDSRAYGTEARGRCSQVWLACQPAQRDSDEGSLGGVPSKDWRHATIRPSGFRMLSPHTRE